MNDLTRIIFYSFCSCLCIDFHYSSIIKVQCCKMRFDIEALLVAGDPSKFEKLRHKFNYISLSPNIFWKYF